MHGMVLAIERAWYGSPGLLWLLLPLELLFALGTALRRWCYRAGVFASHHPGCPVVVIGNITAGGSGKTPVVLTLANRLLERGLAPAVVSRGYGGAATGVTRVHADARPEDVGEEALLIAQSAPCPVYIGKDRVAAARAAGAEGADVVLCDDGLQHYRLKRDVEVIVMDASNPLGNGHLMPVGPLREGAWRLNTADFLLEHSGSESSRALAYDPARLRHLRTGEYRSIDDSGFGPGVHALAAIARPGRFFNTLRKLGFDVEEHPLRDHSEILAEHLTALADRPVVVTAKDAPKIPVDAHPEVWVLEMNLELPRDFVEKLLVQLNTCRLNT